MSQGHKGGRGGRPAAARPGQRRPRPKRKVGWHGVFNPDED